MMRATWLCLVWSFMAGCTVTVEHVGPHALFEDAGSPSGGRVDSIVAAFGIPDEIDVTKQGFGFVYHFARRNERRFQIGSYGFKLATDERVEHREGSFVLFFDGAGRLLGSATHDHTPTRAEPADE